MRQRERERQRQISRAAEGPSPHIQWKLESKWHKMLIVLPWSGALAAVKADLNSFQVFPNPHPGEQAEGNISFTHLSCPETNAEYDPRKSGPPFITQLCMKQGQSLTHPSSGPHPWKFLLTFSHPQPPYSPVPLSHLYNKTTSSHMENSSNFCPVEVSCIQGFAILLAVGIYNDGIFWTMLWVCVYVGGSFTHIPQDRLCFL